MRSWVVGVGGERGASQYPRYLEQGRVGPLFGMRRSRLIKIEEKETHHWHRRSSCTSRRVLHVITDGTSLLVQALNILLRRGVTTVTKIPRFRLKSASLRGHVLFYTLQARRLARLLVTSHPCIDRVVMHDDATSGSSL